MRRPKGGGGTAASFGLPGRFMRLAGQAAHGRERLTPRHGAAEPGTIMRGGPVLRQIVKQAPKRAEHRGSELGRGKFPEREALTCGWSASLSVSLVPLGSVRFPLSCWGSVLRTRHVHLGRTPSSPPPPPLLSPTNSPPSFLHTFLSSLLPPARAHTYPFRRVCGSP